MKAASSALLAAMLAAGTGAPALSAPVTNPAAVRVAQAAPAADFGSPPSGEIPILFNDHHVYTKPDRLKQERVLAALVRGSTILIPLRSMFEQMGATVSWDPGTRTADVSKPGSDVKVTVGRKEVVINGEARPLDVPPEIYRGTVVVPVRVISEGMGAYVQWVPERKLVVVRYVAATPPPPPPPPPPSPVATAPPPPPPPTPTPAPTPLRGRETFVAGDYLFQPTVYNEFSPGNKGGNSYSVWGATEFPLGKGFAVYAEGDYRQYQYPHYGNPRFDQNGNTGANGNFDGFAIPVCQPGGAAYGDQGCVATLGYPSGTSFVPSFVAQEQQLEGHVGIGVPFPRIFVAASFVRMTNNWGYPVRDGLGAGLEKLPDLDQAFSLYGNIFYYPNIDGTYNGIGLIGYRMWRYRGGGTLTFPRFPLYVEAGVAGDHAIPSLPSTPSGFSHQTYYAGVGIHF